MPLAAMLAASASTAASLCGTLRAFLGDFLSLLRGTSMTAPLSMTISDVADMVWLLGVRVQAQNAPAALPVGETGCASGAGAFAGNRLQGPCPVLGRWRPCEGTEAGRKALRSAPRAEP